MSPLKVVQLTIDCKVEVFTDVAERSAQKKRTMPELSGCPPDTRNSTKAYNVYDRRAGGQSARMTC